MEGPGVADSMDLEMNALRTHTIAEVHLPVHLRLDEAAGYAEAFVAAEAFGVGEQAASVNPVYLCF